MPSTLAPITNITSIDDVIAAIEGIIGWSIANQSRLGYFAALYKRITIAIKQGIADGGFENGPRMERLDVVFASRYFAALNGYFHPGAYPAPSHCWKVAFEGATHPELIIVQHDVSLVSVYPERSEGSGAYGAGSAHGARS